MRGDQTKTLFVDSTANAQGDFTTVSLPPDQFSTKNGDKLNITLQQFSLKRNFYNVNASNSVGYLGYRASGDTGALKLFPFTIANGIYVRFKGDDGTVADVETQEQSLAVGLENAIIKCITDNPSLSAVYKANDTTARINRLTRKFTITIVATNSSNTDTIRILFLRVPPNNLAPGSALVSETTEEGRYQDIGELIGGNTITTESEALSTTPPTSMKVTSGTGATAGNTIFTSNVPASLHTNSAIYLNIHNVTNQNYASPSFLFKNPQQSAASECTIMARFPIDKSFADSSSDTIEYQDKYDSYAVKVNNGNIPSNELKFCLTDDRGRNIRKLLPVSERQENDVLPWRAVFRFDFFNSPPHQNKLTANDMIPPQPPRFGAIR